MRHTARRKVSYVITHNKDDHGHLLGINSLALDTTTIKPETGEPEGILYSAGRDGVITSWDLHLPFREKRSNIGVLTHNGTDSITIDEANENTTVQKFNDFQNNWEVDLTSPPPQSTFRQSFQSHTDWVNDIVLCHDNESLISASSDRTLKLWHPHKSNSPSIIGYHTDYIKALAHAPGPGWVVSGGFDRKIVIWDIVECRPSSFGIASMNHTEHDVLLLGKISEDSPKSSVYALACNPIGTVLVSGSPEKIVRVWDPRSTKQITSFTGHTDNIRAVLVSNDGELILSGSSDTTIKLWSLKAQRCINTFTIHSDSVWSLYSDHPRLETFYAGSKDGTVTRTDYRGCAEIQDGECVAVCKEDAGVVKLVALDNKYIWTATFDSNIKRWQDVPSRCERTSHSPISSSAIIKLTSTGVSYASVTLDAEVATLYSVTTDEHNMEHLDNEDPIPVRDSPDFIIKGQHGLIKHCILNNRRHILTLDNSGEVALWDIILCTRVKTYGKRDLDEVVKEVNTVEFIPTWCSVDTRVGALKVELDETRCFDAEMYADDIESLEDTEIREDQRINLGKWVLRYLFAKFTQAEIQAYEQTQHYVLQQRQQQAIDNKLDIPQHISFPPTTIRTDDVAGSKAINMNNTPTTPPTVISPSPTTPLAAFTGPFTAPATTGTQQPDYFSGSHHTSPTSTTSPEHLGGGSLSSEVIKPPPPALVSQASNSSGTSSSLFERVKHTISRSKISRGLSTDAKSENNGEGLSSDKLTGVKAGESKLTVSTQFQDETNAHIPKDVDAMVNSPTGLTAQLNQMQFIGDPGQNRQIQPVQNHPIRHLHHLVQPPFPQLSTHETPEIQIPPHTTVIISEESPEASTYADLYRGTVDSMDKDAEIIELKAPTWLIEFVIKNKIPQRDPIKIGFLLRPHEGSELGEMPNGNARLTANRMLRVRKILSYVVEKLELDQPEPNKGDIPNSAEKFSFDSNEKGDNDTEKYEKSSLKPEIWLELVCQDQVLPPTMTLATIKSHIWKSGGDLTMTYRLRMRCV